MVMKVVAEYNPREWHGSLMVLYGTVGCRRSVVVDDVMRVAVRMMVAVMVRVAVCRIVVVLLLGRLPLRVLLVLHSSVLKPYLHLPLG